MPAVAMPGISRRHASDPIVEMPCAGVTQCLKNIQAGTEAIARETWAREARGQSRQDQPLKRASHIDVESRVRCGIAARSEILQS